MLLNSFGLRFGLNMRNLWLEAFTICLFLGATQTSTEEIVCKNCEGYHICGLKTPQTPDCPNGLPCTEKEYQLCTQSTVVKKNGNCDRPGVFAESASPHKFYFCKIKDEIFTFEKKPIICLRNRTFDQSTMRCLTENEKNMLDVAKELTVGYNKKKLKFSCNKTGTFPDPYDCKMYHVCNSKFVSQDFYCPFGTYFNGINCTTTKSKRCIQQLKSQYRDQVLEARTLYQNVKRLLGESSPTKVKPKTSANLIAPGIIKRTFYDKNKTKYTYYGINNNFRSSKSKNTTVDVLDFEKFVENVLAQHEMEKNDSLILSELKSASKSVIGTDIENRTLITSKSGRRICKSSKKRQNEHRTKKNITVNKVTIILITQNYCESCSSQTVGEPITLYSTTEKKLSSSNTSSLVMNDTHVKATTPNTQQILSVNNFVFKPSQFENISLGAQNIYNKSQLQSEAKISTVPEPNTESSAEITDQELLTSSRVQTSTGTTIIENSTIISFSKLKDKPVEEEAPVNFTFDSQTETTQASTAWDPHFSSSLESESKRPDVEDIPGNFTFKQDTESTQKSGGHFFSESNEITSVDREFGAKYTFISKTSTDQNFYSSSSAQSTESVSANNEFSTDLSLDIDTKTALANLSNENFYVSTSPQFESTIFVTQSSGIPTVESKTEFTLTKFSTSGHSYISIFPKPVETVSADEKFSETQSSLAKTSSSGLSDKDGSATFTDAITTDREFSSNAGIESETSETSENSESSLLKISTSPYTVTDFSVHSEEITFSDEEYSEKVTSETESTLMETNTNQNPYITTFPQLEYTSSSKYENHSNVTFESEKSGTQAEAATIKRHPQSLSTSSNQEFFSTSDLGLRPGIYQMTISTTEKFSNSKTSFLESETTTHTIQESDSIPSAQSEGVTSTSHNTESDTQTNIEENSEDNAYSHLKDTTHSTIVESEWTNVPKNKTTSQNIGLNKSPHSISTTFAAEDLHYSSTLESDSITNPTLTYIFINLENGIPHTQRTTLLNQDYHDENNKITKTSTYGTTQGTETVINSAGSSTYTYSFPELQETTFETPNLQSSSILESELTDSSTKISYSQNSDIDAFQFTKMTSINQSPQKAETKTETFPATEMYSDVTSSEKPTSANQKTETYITPIISHAYSSPNLEAVSTSSENIESETGTAQTSSRDSFSKVTSSVIPDGYGNYIRKPETKSTVTATNFLHSSSNIDTSLSFEDTTATVKNILSKFTLGSEKEASAMKANASQYPTTDFLQSAKTTSIDQGHFSNVHLDSETQTTSDDRRLYFSKTSQEKSGDVNLSTEFKESTSADQVFSNGTDLDLETKTETSTDQYFITDHTETYSVVQKNFNSGIASTSVKTSAPWNSHISMSSDLGVTSSSSPQSETISTDSTNQYSLTDSFTQSLQMNFADVHSSITESRTETNQKETSTTSYFDIASPTRFTGTAFTDEIFSSDIPLDSVTKIMFAKTNTSLYPNTDLPIYSTKITPSDYGSRSTMTLETDPETVLMKASINRQPFFSTHSQLEDTTATMEHTYSNRTLGTGTETPVMKSSTIRGRSTLGSEVESTQAEFDANQHTGANSSTQFKETNTADEGFSSDIFLEAEAEYTLSTSSSQNFKSSLSIQSAEGISPNQKFSSSINVDPGTKNALMEISSPITPSYPKFEFSTKVEGVSGNFTSEQEAITTDFVTNQHSNISSYNQSLETTIIDELFPSNVFLDLKSETTLKKFSVTRHPIVETTPKPIETTFTDEQLFSSLNSGLSTKTSLPKIIISQYFDGGRSSTISETTSDQKLSSGTPLESETETVDIKTSTKRQSYMSTYPELEGTSATRKDIRPTSESETKASVTKSSDMWYSGINSPAQLTEITSKNQEYSTHPESEYSRTKIRTDDYSFTEPYIQSIKKSPSDQGYSTTITLETDTGTSMNYNTDSFAKVTITTVSDQNAVREPYKELISIKTKTSQQPYKTTSTHWKNATATLKDIQSEPTLRSVTEDNVKIFSTSRYYRTDSPTQSTKTTSSGENFSTSAAFEPETETVLMKTSTNEHFGTKPTFVDQELYDKEILASELGSTQSKAVDGGKFHSNDMFYSGVGKVTTAEMTSFHLYTNTSSHSTAVTSQSTYFDSNTTFDSETETVTANVSTNHRSNISTSEPAIVIPPKYWLFESTIENLITTENLSLEAKPYSDEISQLKKTTSYTKPSDLPHFVTGKFQVLFTNTTESEMSTLSKTGTSVNIPHSSQVATSTARELYNSETRESETMPEKTSVTFSASPYSKMTTVQIENFENSTVLESAASDTSDTSETSYYTKQPSSNTKSQTQNIHGSTNLESEALSVEKITNQLFLTNLLFSKGTPSEFQNVYSNMTAEPENMTTSSETSTSKSVSNSTPFQLESTITSAPISTFSHSYMSTLLRSSTTTSQTQEISGSTHLNLETEIISTVKSTSEPSDYVTTFRTTTDIIKPSISKPVNFIGFSHLKETASPNQNTDSNAIQEAETKTSAITSMVRPSVEDRYSSTTSEPGTNTFKTKTTEERINTFHSVRDTSETLDITTSAHRLASGSILKEINTSPNIDTDTSLHPEATISASEDLDMSVGEESETTAILRKTNTSHGPDFSKTSDLIKMSTPRYETVTTLKKSSTILAHTASDLETISSRTPQHSYISTLHHSKPTLSETENIHVSTTPRLEMTLTPGETTTTQYLHTSTYLHPIAIPSNIQDLFDSFKVKPETATSETKTSSEEHAYDSKLFNSEQTTSRKDISDNKPLKSEKETEEARTNILNSFYYTSSPLVEKIAPSTSHNSKSASVSAVTVSPINIRYEFRENDSTADYSHASVTPLSNKTLNFQGKVTSFNRAVQISSTLSPENKPKSNLNGFKSFRCTRVGLFRDPKDCHSYYRCKFLPKKSKKCLFCKPKRWNLVAIHEVCPGKKWFSALLLMCISVRPLLC